MIIVFTIAADTKHNSVLEKCRVSNRLVSFTRMIAGASVTTMQQYRETGLLAKKEGPARKRSPQVESDNTL